MTREQDIHKALTALRSGGIILYPTDTIWGIGCDATDTEAVQKIFNLKCRCPGKAMISLTDSLHTLEKWVESIPPAAEEAIKNAREPLTVIYPRPIGISDLLKAEDGSAAFRICGLEFTRELIRRLGHPLVSTSANISSEPSPAEFSLISKDVKEGVDYIVEHGRELSPSKPSRILKVNDSGDITVIR